MKKALLLAFLAVSFIATRAQVTIASGLDSLDNPIFGEVYLFDIEESVPFYIIVDDSKPITCNKFKVTAYLRDYIGGKKENDYWVLQGDFDFPITPNYYGYWLQMNAYYLGEYKIEVSGYLNGNYMQSYGSTTFNVWSEDDFWDSFWY